MKTRNAVLVIVAALAITAVSPSLGTEWSHWRADQARGQHRRAPSGSAMNPSLPGRRTATAGAAVPGAMDTAKVTARYVMRTALAARRAALRRARAARHRRHRGTVRLCRRYQHVKAFGEHGAGVVVRNDSYGGLPECLANVNRWANFAVASAVRRRVGVEPVAFPNIFYGCSWGVCSPGSRLPRRLSRLHDPVTSWYTAGRPAGRWDAAYDIWFARRRHTSGQDHGAEIMLWLRTGGLGRPSARHSLRIGKWRWQVMHWTTKNPATGDRWPLIIFRMVHPRGYVRHLRLMPFFRHVQALGLLRRSWWLTAVEAGFEVWRGGRGLRTTSFWVRP